MSKGLAPGGRVQSRRSAATVEMWAESPCSRAMLSRACSLRALRSRAVMWPCAPRRPPARLPPGLLELHSRPLCPEPSPRQMKWLRLAGFAATSCPPSTLRP